MKRARLLNVTAMSLIATAVLGGIWLTGRGHESVGPDALRVPATVPTSSPSPQPDPVAYSVCAEGYGWVRPSLDDQRRHLASLGGELQQFASDPGSLFAGAYVGDAQGRNIWHYAIFWTFVSEPKYEQYALARSGLWSATPNTSGCDRSARLTLLIDHAATDMRFGGDTVSITARAVPGYFQYVQYTLPADIHSVGYRLLAEDGTFIDACCT